MSTLARLLVTESTIGATYLSARYLKVWRPRHRASVKARRSRPTRCDPMTLTSNAGLSRGSVIEIGTPRRFRAPREGRYVVKRVINPRFVKVTLVRKAPLWWRSYQWMKGN